MQMIDAMAPRCRKSMFHLTKTETNSTCASSNSDSDGFRTQIKSQTETKKTQWFIWPQGPQQKQAFEPNDSDGFSHMIQTLTWRVSSARVVTAAAKTKDSSSHGAVPPAYTPPWRPWPWEYLQLRPYLHHFLVANLLHRCHQRLPLLPGTIRCSSSWWANWHPSPSLHHPCGLNFTHIIVLRSPIDAGIHVPIGEESLMVWVAAAGRAPGYW